MHSVRDEGFLIDYAGFHFRKDIAYIDSVSDIYITGLQRCQLLGRPHLFHDKRVNQWHRTVVAFIPNKGDGLAAHPTLKFEGAGTDDAQGVLTCASRIFVPIAFIHGIPEMLGNDRNAGRYVPEKRCRRLGHRQLEGVVVDDPG